jgi:hypothetical protein
VEIIESTIVIVKQLDDKSLTGFGVPMTILGLWPTGVEKLGRLPGRGSTPSAFTFS